MKRKEFIQKSAVLGLGLPFLTQLMGCADDENFVPNWNGKVLIIGGGSAGLMAAHILQRNGIEFEILEAGTDFGGRVKKIDDFVDFPIDLGAEWIHTNPDIFSRLIDDPDIKGEIDVIPYQPKSIYTWKDGKTKQVNWVSSFYAEYKFKNTTWYDFFDDFIVPNFKDKIRLESPVSKINSDSDKVQVTLENNDVLEADKVLVTVPIKMLQMNKIEFTPALSQEKLDAINDINIPPGIKVFIEFSQRFYPDWQLSGGLTESGSTDKLYYDAAFKKNANSHVMGLFWVNDNANEFTDLSTDQEIIDAILVELDEMYDGAATRHYVKHVVQNWSKEPYIGGAYTFGFSKKHSDIIEAITKPINNKVYFAGEAVSEEAYSTVHGAGLSGVNEAKRMLTV